MDENMTIHRGRGLVDLIAGVVPTFDSWTNDPTDAADITDGDISTFCTTGDKVAGGAWQYAHFDWDLGGMYNVLVGGVMGIGATAGSGVAYLHLWNGAAWIVSAVSFASDAAAEVGSVYAGMGSQVRLSIAGSVAATITPNVRELNVWRLE